MATLRIRILPDEAVNKVAAGEVVERPASALKELVENSLDAGAGRIRISLEKAGRGLIRVGDDGRGMTHDDALLSLERHSTSKITDAEDLVRVGTLGFRGEALPSLAAVSRMQITTRTVEEEEGTRIVVDGGKILKVSPWGAPVGTEVDIRSLFRNVPARLKFLKSNATELSHCVGIITRLSFAHPSVEFNLTHGGKTLLHLPAAAGHAERLTQYLGEDFFGNLLPFQADAGQRHARGFVARPGSGRKGGDYQQFFVNGRPVRDIMLLKGIKESCREYFLKEREPLSFFIWITIPPEEVDVNVHPTKREVRFRDLTALRALLGRAIHDTLRRDRTAWSEPSSDPLPEPLVGEKPATYPRHLPQAEQLPLEPHSFRSPEPGFSPASPSAQLFSTYLVSLRPDGLVLVDQHAAHERVLYEKVLKLLEEGKSQRLLHPLVLELSPAEETVLEDLVEELDNHGIEVERFGPRAYRLTALPLELSRKGAESFVRELIERFRKGGDAPPVAEFRHQIAATMACHGSVRANQTLQPQEAHLLLRDLFLADDPAHCPHGRPTFIRMDRKEIEKRFKRT